MLVVIFAVADTYFDWLHTFVATSTFVVVEVSVVEGLVVESH
jgi:hypothetical protein